MPKTQRSRYFGIKDRVNFTGHPSNHFSGCRLNGQLTDYKVLKVFFSESVLHFSDCPKMCQKLSWKRYFEIVLCLESADSNNTAKSKGGKIQNTKLRNRTQHIFWAMEIIPIFVREYRTFREYLVLWRGLAKIAFFLLSAELDKLFHFW